MPAPIIAMNLRSAAKAAKVVRGGGLVIFPTDTVYGLGCDPFDAGAVDRLFDAKGRSSKPVSVLCSSKEKAGELVVLGRKATILAQAHWPGALTIVARLRKPVPPRLTQGSPFLGVRVPAHEGCLRLISLCGGWLTGTSANISGKPSARTAQAAARMLRGRVDLVLDGGRLNGAESTVAKVDENAVTILRTGPIGVGNEATGRRTS